ncbi:helix-turn-helix transcriptional regulator [Calidifontibacter sp. DB0510]|uniref:Helix-turn-helix transcriptional regulator n=1 Tax=Metallococcus carri TaxID=1656884 RepID=A0A967AXE2_9MICO|nr:helix-turn-helix transcriptional regulator [Metallococcus carri]NHN54741.1 helix-turn-helix transcriptional regulator [Metallococcus carri]NOP37086.1 helix-turn-helix transcriptional regulator [Calidifontibacter sp. DB2511S]
MARGRVLLRQARAAAGLTQQTLAARSGVSARTIGALERGTITSPHPGTLQALIDVLGPFTPLADALREAFGDDAPASYDEFASVERGLLSGGSIDDLVASVVDPARHRWRELAATHRVTVGEDGRILRAFSHRVLQAKTPTARITSLLKAGDDATPVALSRLVDWHGCEPLQRLDLRDHNAALFTFRVSDSRAGSTVSVSYEFAEAPEDLLADPQLAALAAGRPLSDGIVRSTSSPDSTLVVDVQFLRPPKAVWELSYTAGDHDAARGRLITPDRDGIVQMVRSGGPAGGIGFDWEW